ncbi:hypothetical protein M2158_005833 [Streptomyces sp. SAI-144]|uniref:cation:dicarboxylate symporter family transporter n=1 Tax=Streptomyces sp. SAI-144 TaxID=2940544 RepID=UPI0024751F76|nr:cation:dicarboxylase symporter family transporter [Streptomyces sp. SAI-144]MDH6437292.1 hypothetical protein [Streptomyces sp. SAI-144]
MRSARRPALPGIVLPSGFSINLNGSAVYLTMASLFLAQARASTCPRQQQLIMVGVTMLTSKGTAGIAGGPFIVRAGTVTAVGHIPLAALSLIVGIDRILNEAASSSTSSATPPPPSRSAIGRTSWTLPRPARASSRGRRRVQSPLNRRRCTP